MTTNQRSQRELDEQAAKTRKRLALTAAAALLLLRRKRNAIVESGLAAGLPVPLIGQKLSRGLAVSIAEARTIARTAGRKRLIAEAKSADLPVTEASHAVGRARMAEAEDLYRGRVAADNIAKRWMRKASGGTAKEAAAAANEATAGTLRRAAVTESSTAFNEYRLYEGRSLFHDLDVDLYRRWDALADACPACALLDGKIVKLGEPFPGGEPGSVHPNCLCSWELLTAKEAGKAA